MAFSLFKKKSEPAVAPAPSAPAPARIITPPVSKAPSVSAEQPKPVAAPKPAVASAPAAEQVDTVASFNFLCEALVDINKSQLQVVDLILTTFAGSVNKIADAFKPKA
jgi:hypothetical protein